MLLFFLGAFSSQDAKENPSNQNNNDSSQVQRRFIQAKTSQLRLRNTPDLQGIVVETITGTGYLEYLEDSTQFKTSIKMGGQEVQASWYKVKTPKGNIGWVFGGVVEFLSEAENQQINGFLARNQNLNRNGKVDKGKQQLNQAALEQYQARLQSLSPQQQGAVAAAAAAFEQILGKTNPLTCDAGFVAYRSFFQKALQANQNHNLQRYHHLSKEVLTFSKADMQTDDFTQELAANGFDFGTNGTQVFVREDIDFTLKHFYRFLSEEMRQYLDLQQQEQLKPWRSGNRININLEQFADRVASWDEFVVLFPQFVWKNEAQEILRSQFEAFFNELLNQQKALPKCIQWAQKYYPNSRIKTHLESLQQLLSEGKSPQECRQTIQQWKQNL
jgi:hypothetical protein